MSEAQAKKETQITTVTMLNGETVDFAGKRRMNKTISANSSHLFLRIDFINGETRQFSCPHGYGDPTDPAAKLMLKAAGHGLSQKLGDEAANVKDIDDAVEAIDQLILRLEQKGADGWTEGATGGSGMAGASVLAKALVRAMGVDIKVVREYLAGLDNKTKAALRLDPSVAPHIKQLEEEARARAEQRGKTAAPTIDTNSVLEALRAQAQPAT